MEELNNLIGTIEDNEYIDVCKSDNYFEDDGNYGLILRHLKKSQQLQQEKASLIEWLEKEIEILDDEYLHLGKSAFITVLNKIKGGEK